MMRKIFIVPIILIFAASSFAQYGSSGIGDAKSAGLAGTYNVTASGSYAYGINPANIINPLYRGDLIFLLPLPQVNIKASTGSFSIDDLNYFFGGVDGEPRNLSRAEVDRLNNLFKDAGVGSYFMSLNMLSFAVNLPVLNGAIGFSISDVFAGNFRLPPDAAEFTLSGNLINHIYSFNDAEFKSWWVRNYSLTYARTLNEIKPGFLDQLNAGLSLKLVHGYAYAGTERVNSFIEIGDRSEITGRADYLAYTSVTKDIGIDYEFDDKDPAETNLHLFPPPAGSGFGVDIGFTAVYDRNWTFALSLTDIGSLRWKNNAARFLAEGDIILNDITNHAMRDSIADIIAGEGSYVDGFTTSLPTALRAGASYSFMNDNDGIPGNLLLAADYNQGFNKLPGNTTAPRFSVAAEWQPLNWSIIRMGFSFGGLDKFNWAAGFGFVTGIIELNIATTNILAVPAPNSANHLSVSVNSRWVFR